MLHFILRFFPNFYFVYNNNKTLIPKFLDWLWILNKLIKVGHIYYFPSFYSIRKHRFSLRIGSSGDKSKDWQFGAAIGGLLVWARCNMVGGRWVWLYSWWGWDRIGLVDSCCWCDGGRSMAVGSLSFSFCFGFFF